MTEFVLRGNQHIVHNPYLPSPLSLSSFLPPFISINLSAIYPYYLSIFFSIYLYTYLFIYIYITYLLDGRSVTDISGSVEKKYFYWRNNFQWTPYIVCLPLRYKIFLHIYQVQHKERLQWVKLCQFKVFCMYNVCFSHYTSILLLKHLLFI